MRDPEQKNHPLKSLYHLCNETRFRLEQEDLEDKRKKLMRNYQALHDFRMDPSDKLSSDCMKSTFKDKLGSSKLALAFKKLFKTGFKPIPIRKDLERLNAVKSAQVLPSTPSRKMEIPRKKPLAFLDSETSAINSTNATTMELLEDDLSNPERRIKIGGKALTWTHKKSRSDGYEILKKNGHFIH